MQRRTNNENTDGADIPRSTGQHWPQDRLLAGGIRGALLYVQGRWCRADAGLTERRTAPNRSKERFAGESDSCDGTVQAGRGAAKGAVPDIQAVRYEVGRLRHDILPGRPWPHVGPR